VNNAVGGTRQNKIYKIQVPLMEKEKEKVGVCVRVCVGWVYYFEYPRANSCTREVVHLLLLEVGNNQPREYLLA
jgi:hypothetical protein